MPSVVSIKLINQFKKLTYERNRQENFRVQSNTDVSEMETKLMTAEYDKYFTTLISQLPQM